MKVRFSNIYIYVYMCTPSWLITPKHNPKSDLIHLPGGSRQRITALDAQMCFVWSLDGYMGGYCPRSFVETQVRKAR